MLGAGGGDGATRSSEGGGGVRVISEGGRARRRSEVRRGGVREGVVGRREEAATGLAAEVTTGGVTGLPTKYPAPHLG